MCFSVEEIEKQPTYGDIACVVDYPCYRLGTMGGRSAEKEIRNAAESDDPLRHIDRDGVQPDYTEEKGPSFPAPHVDQVIEQCEQSQ